jgi:hypothetical protein
MIIIMMDQLCKRIQDVLPWDKLVCKGGNTQNKERIYIPVIKKAIHDLGGEVGHEAGSQQAMDFRDVTLPGLDFVFDADGKSVNKGFKFMFNDSLLKLDGYYVFVQVEHKSVIIKKGIEIINYIAELEQMTCVEVINRLRDREKAILSVKNFKIGASNAYIDSYARPSWSVKLPREWFGIKKEKSKEEIEKEIDDFFDGNWPQKNSDDARRYEHFCARNDKKVKLILFLESLTQQSSESGVEEQHSQAEQPDPSMNPPSRSPLETPESV